MSDAASKSELFRSLGRLLAPGAFVVDVGANEGQFALRLDSEVPVRAFCIEPGSSAAARLDAAIGHRSDWEHLRSAISNKSGDAPLFVSQSDIGSSLLQPVAGQTSQWAQTVDIETVLTRRLDEVAESEGWSRIDLLKIDTQGADLLVLQSAGELLNASFIGGVLIEANFHNMYHQQASFGDIYNYLFQRGYFLAELFRYYNQHDWLWYGDALFLPNLSKYSTSAHL